VVVVVTCDLLIERVRESESESERESGISGDAVT
jgi:hypothetical protein